jgi:hypothetical protein
MRSPKTRSVFDVTILSGSDTLLSELKAGGDPNYQNCAGVTALQRTSILGYVEETKILLKAGANPNLCNKYGQTPLHFVNNKEIALMLLKSGASTNAIGLCLGELLTPLEYAIRVKKKDVIEVLSGPLPSIDPNLAICLGRRAALTPGQKACLLWMTKQSGVWSLMPKDLVRFIASFCNRLPWDRQLALADTRIQNIHQ